MLESVILTQAKNFNFSELIRCQRVIEFINQIVFLFFVFEPKGIFKQLMASENS